MLRLAWCRARILSALGGVVHTGDCLVMWSIELVGIPPKGIPIAPIVIKQVAAILSS